MTKFLTLLLACISCVGALDIAFDELYCNKSLPVYATAGDVQMTCNDEQSTRCSFGQDVSLRGSCELKSRRSFGMKQREEVCSTNIIFDLFNVIFSAISWLE